MSANQLSLLQYNTTLSYNQKENRGGQRRLKKLIEATLINLTIVTHLNQKLIVSLTVKISVTPAVKYMRGKLPSASLVFNPATQRLKAP